MFNKTLFCLGLLFSLSLWADSSETDIQIKSKSNKTGKEIDIWNDDVFKLGDEVPAPPRTSKGADGRERYIDYSQGRENVLSRQQRLETCAAEKNNPSSYRACNERERAKQQNKYKNNVETVEKKQSNPFRNMNKLPNMEIGDAP